VYAEPLDGTVSPADVSNALVTLCRNSTTDPGWSPPARLRGAGREYGIHGAHTSAPVAMNLNRPCGKDLRIVSGGESYACRILRAKWNHPTAAEHKSGPERSQKNRLAPLLWLSGSKLQRGVQRGSAHG